MSPPDTVEMLFCSGLGEDALLSGGGHPGFHFYLFISSWTILTTLREFSGPDVQPGSPKSSCLHSKQVLGEFQPCLVFFMPCKPQAFWCIMLREWC